jgi:hypothetical protein
MIRKIIAATLALAMLAALIPVSLADSGNVTPYSGWIGADSPLYSLKIFAQNLDLSLTFNNTAKMNKEMAYADERLSEAEAMLLANNSAGLQAALANYDNEINDLNLTAQAPDINNSDYCNLSTGLYDHAQAFYDMMNNSTVPQKCLRSIQNATNATIRLRDGMPFINYNNTTYFIPPGQFKNNNSTFVPPGQAKKDYGRPTPTVVNGSPTWPWDQINFTNGTRNFTMPKIMPMPTMEPMKNIGNGNGNGYGNGIDNGYGNGNGHGNGYGNGNDNGYGNGHGNGNGGFGD